ncbi:MAG: uroporphyrinogen decarboxylase family protein [Actinomycetota bacterium]
MSAHIELVKKAIEFNKPGYLPMETNHVPYVYNAYHTLDPATVKSIPGTEDFDSLWPLCYSWVHKEIGKTEKGESLRKDQFGTTLKIPLDYNSTYVLLDHPLKDKDSLDDYFFPDPSDLDVWFEKFGEIISQRYTDRFLNAFIDAGIFLTTMMLMGTNDFYLRLATDLDFVVEVYSRAAHYYKEIALKFKKCGAHMITVIEDLGQKRGMVMNPDVWRKKFKPILNDFYKFVHDHGMYTALCVDGDTKNIHEDILDMDIDLFFLPDINTTGIKSLVDNLKGKICLKASVDMLSTLSSGTPEQVQKEAENIVESLNSKDGGFICEVVKWYRPQYRDENVMASVRGFNKYRRQ